MKKNYSKFKNALLLSGVLFFAVTSFWACSSTEKSSAVDSTATGKPDGANNLDSASATKPEGTSVPVDSTATGKPDGANN